MIIGRFIFRKNRTMLKLEFVQAFAAIAEAGSGTRLIRRTPRRLALTEDGTAFYERATGILRDVESAAAELSARRGLVAGPLRISAPVGFGSLHLGPALFGFLRENPGIELTL